jgi:hypothetical protein
MRRALFVILGSLLLAGHAGADLSPDQLAALRDRLDQLAEAISTGNPDETARQTAALQQWARQLDPSLPVDLICERVSIGRSDAEARQLSETIRQLSGNLDALLAQEPAGDHLASARETLVQVLAADEYRHSIRRSWWQLLMMRVYRWLEWLMQLLSRIPGAEKVASVMFYLVVPLLLLPLLGAIGYLIWWQAKQRRSAPQLETSASVRMLESPETHLGRADELLRQGRSVEALKQFHLAALAALEQRGLVAPDRTRTNWEYLAQLQARPAPPESVSLLRALNALYDRAVFGTHPCDEPFAHAFGQQSRMLMQTVAAGSFHR